MRDSIRKPVAACALTLVGLGVIGGSFAQSADPKPPPIKLPADTKTFADKQKQKKKEAKAVQEQKQANKPLSRKQVLGPIAANAGNGGSLSGSSGPGLSIPILLPPATSSGGNGTAANANGDANGDAAAAVNKTAAGAKTYNAKILEYGLANLGKQVGNGECWTLAEEALKYAGAQPPNLYVWGEVIPLADVTPGDILQFESARFVGPGYWMQLGAPHHTGIVSSVTPTGIMMLNQNVNGSLVDQMSVIHLADHQSGTITAYRAVAPK